MSIPTNQFSDGSFPRVPYPTIDDLLQTGRALLLDSDKGPRVPGLQEAGAATGLVDVRVRGKPYDAGGTLNWTPGAAGVPFGILDTARATKKYAETGRVWTDWQASLSLGLTTDLNTTEDYDGWARAWEAVMQQWFPLHRGFGLIGDPTGDHWWEYTSYDGTRVYHAASGVVVYGPVFLLTIHNVTPLTWGA